MGRKYSPEVVDRLVATDTAEAKGYAWGRMDAGDPPVIPMPGESLVDGSATAAKFAELFGRQLRQLLEGTSESTPMVHGLGTSWTAFVETGGETIQPQWARDLDAAMREEAGS